MLLDELPPTAELEDEELELLLDDDVAPFPL
jgi:hypothetical protein